MAEKERNLHERLTDLQVELKAPKGQYNSFGKYSYRSAEDILEAVKPLTKKHELTFMISDEPVMVGDRIYIKATAKIIYKDQSEEVTAYARESLSKKGQDDSQITGTASSYARKYAMNGLFLIDDTKDADTDENKNETNARTKKETQQQNKKTNAPKLDEKKQNLLQILITTKAEERGVTVGELWLGIKQELGIKVGKFEELTDSQFKAIEGYFGK